jgi:outer membrane protein assembly factor BamB
MSNFAIRLLVVGLVVAGMIAAAQQPLPQSLEGDWPMWRGSANRNAVSAETGIPAEWEAKTKRQVKWVARLGTQTYGTPIVSDDRIYIGTNNGGIFRPHSMGDKGCLLCIDARDGSLVWQATHDKLPSGDTHDYSEVGIVSGAYIDGERVYYVSNRSELVCADVRGFYDNENDGPFTSERFTEKQDADLVWVFDMIGELSVFPHASAVSSPVGAGDLVFVCTGNGVGEEYTKVPAPVPAPQAPSLIAVNKETGQVVWQRNDPGTNILHGQWSSPAYGIINGVPQVVFGGGDGWCYGFEPGTGNLLWRFNMNPKDAVWGPGGKGGTKLSIVATPVIYNDKVFLGGGNQPSSCEGHGRLYAIDATQRGDITDSGRLWLVGGRQFGRTVSTVVIADGLLYAADVPGFLYCFDVNTGQRYWRYNTKGEVWGSPIVVDGKVILGNADGDVHVLKHSRKLERLAVNEMPDTIYTTPTPANGTLYIATHSRLYAIERPESNGQH